MSEAGLSWFGIVRLGLVQAAIGSIVVIATSTINRVMVVELALPAVIPGLLVALHHAVQIMRPRLGHGSDGGQRRTPWIVGGMALLGAASVAAAAAVPLMEADRTLGLLLAVVAFTFIGIGVGTAGTTLLAMLAKRVAPGRRAASGTIVWTMMIAGIAITAHNAGKAMQPYSPALLVEVTALVAAGALVLTVLALFGIERDPPPAHDDAREVPFREAFAEAWADLRARRFTFFVFLSMLAYSTQDLVLEPYAGTVFGLDPGGTTILTGRQHVGVLVGMIVVGIAGSGVLGAKLGGFRTWTIAGCLLSALALAGLAFGGLSAGSHPLVANVIALGAANGAYAVAAIGAMMGLAAERGAREGVRMGLFGAAQAVAFAAGDVLGPLSSDVATLFTDSPGASYAAVFLMQAMLFVASALLAARIFDREPARAEQENSGMGPLGALARQATKGG